MAQKRHNPADHKGHEVHVECTTKEGFRIDFDDDGMIHINKNVHYEVTRVMFCCDDCNISFPLRRGTYEWHV